MEGFISIHRTIKTHWICDNPNYLRAWLFMLMIANYKNGKLLLGNNIYTIKRGQSSLSIRSWAYEFKMSTKATENFFKLLIKDGMIKKEIIGKGKQSTTLITIENYDSFQNVAETLEKRNGIARDTQETHKGNARGVQSNKGNKDNKGNKEINNITIVPFDEFLTYALDKKPMANKIDLKHKYESWVENGWAINRSGKLEPIINWKSTLLNTLKYISEVKPQNKTISL